MGRREIARQALCRPRRSLFPSPLFAPALAHLPPTIAFLPSPFSLLSSSFPAFVGSHRNGGASVPFCRWIEAPCGALPVDKTFRDSHPQKRGDTNVPGAGVLFAIRFRPSRRLRTPPRKPRSESRNLPSNRWVPWAVILPSRHRSIPGNWTSNSAAYPGCLASTHARARTRRRPDSILPRRRRQGGIGKRELRAGGTPGPIPSGVLREC